MPALQTIAAILGHIAIGLTMLALAYGFSRWIGREKARPKLVQIDNQSAAYRQIEEGE